MSLPTWVPAEIPYANYGGDWDRFIEAVYAQFKTDFLDELDQGRLTFDGLPLKLRKQPLVKGKESSFWHLVSTGDIEADRLPDLDRCECIGWAKAILSHFNDPEVKSWENSRNGKTNVCLWLESENYLVVLSKRSGYYLLLTAYFANEYKRKKLLAEYKAYHGI